MTWLADAGAVAGDLADLRHELHRRPEVGLHLPLTQAAVLAALDGLPLQTTTGTTSTSVTAVLRGDATPTGTAPGGTRPVVLLRADMDALPVHEEVDVAFRSTVDGAMHACGHDLHTSMLVGAARLLSARRADLAGDVVFMFQPGEEGFDGAAHMIAEGVLDAAGRRADAAYALHVFSDMFPRGRVVSRGGPVMAASDGLFVTVTGRGGHGAMPHLSRDPVPAACEMILAIHAQLDRAVNAFDPAVVTVGSLHAGTKRNIIPSTASFEATVRTFDPSVRQLVRDFCERVCRGIAEAHGVGVEVDYRAEYPVLVNDPDETEFALGVAADLFGDPDVAELPRPLVTSEDFSRVSAAVPGAMLLVGALLGDRDLPSAPSNHSPAAAFDDSVLAKGAALYASLAASRLAVLAGPAARRDAT